MYFLHMQLLPPVSCVRDPLMTLYVGAVFDFGHVAAAVVLYWIDCISVKWTKWLFMKWNTLKDIQYFLLY